MARALMGPALFLLPIDFISGVLWIFGLILLILELCIHRRARLPAALTILFAPACFIFGSFIYSGIVSGQLRSFHEFLYRL
jgi:hypothetical protein